MGWNGGIRVTHEASLAATVGSFAQNVVYRSAKDHVCPICGGAKGAGYAVCVSCSTHQHSPYKAQLADMVRIIRVSSLADLTAINEGTRPACDRIDRLVDEARNLMDTRQEALLDACVRELEDAVDTLNGIIEQEDRDPSALESAAIAEAEQAIDELRDQLDTLDDEEREEY